MIKPIKEEELFESLEIFHRGYETVAAEFGLTEENCPDRGLSLIHISNIIQKNSDRKMQPFVKINCGAISPNLIESEFFGYEKGAFTGAKMCIRDRFIAGYLYQSRRKKAIQFCRLRICAF